MLKIQIILIIGFLLVGCVGHQNASEFDLVALENTAIQLEHINEGSIPKNKWPPAVRELSPESVIKTSAGIYISLSSFWVQESGLFLSASGKLHDLNGDPSYRLLGGSIYSYYIRG